MFYKYTYTHYHLHLHDNNKSDHYKNNSDNVYASKPDNSHTLSSNLAISSNIDSSNVDVDNNINKKDDKNKKWSFLLVIIC